LTRPPGESAKRVSVSAAGSELAVYIRRGLNEDVTGRTLSQKPRAQRRKPCCDKKKE